MPLAESPHRVGVDVPCNGAGAEATQGRQITAHGRTLGTSLHPITGIVGQLCAPCPWKLPLPLLSLRQPLNRSRRTWLGGRPYPNRSPTAVANMRPKQLGMIGVIGGVAVCLSGHDHSALIGFPLPDRLRVRPHLRGWLHPAMPTLHDAPVP
jgi:hypothetical protein